jgi:hypothetical protein
MIRHGVQWRTNASQGARCEAVAADGEIARLAVAATSAVGASYAGVDIIQDRRGRLMVLEVNSMPAWAPCSESLRRHRQRPGRHLVRCNGDGLAPSPRGRQTLMLAGDAVAAAYRDACLAELVALKPGNVHVFAGGHDMTTADFEASAAASAPAMGAPALSVGARIFEAIRRTREAVGCNTNLGIVLLCAPLAQARCRRAAAACASA